MAIVPVMLGPAMLFLAAISPDSGPVGLARPQAVDFQPTGAVTAKARASVRIISGVSFGPGIKVDTAGATIRRASLNGADGSPYPAEILEFQ